MWMHAKSLQSYPTLCDPMDCSSVHGILQIRVLEWVAVPSSRGSSRPRDRTHVSYISCTEIHTGASLVAQTVKLYLRSTWVRSLVWEDSMEEGTATHSSILAWRIPWTEEPGRLYSPWGRKESSDFHFFFTTSATWEAH